MNSSTNQIMYHFAIIEMEGGGGGGVSKIAEGLSLRALRFFTRIHILIYLIFIYLLNPSHIFLQ